GVRFGDDVDYSQFTRVFANAGPGTEITVTVSGLTLVGADAGNYMLTSTEATTTADIYALPVITSAVKTSYHGADISCALADDGKITVTATGTGTLEYSKDNGVTYQAGNEFSDLAAGTYQIVVRDANGCVSEAEAVKI